MPNPDAISAGHPTKEELQQFLQGSLSAERQADLETHIAECEQCCEVLQAIHESSEADTLIGALKQFDTQIESGASQKTDTDLSDATPLTPRSWKTTRDMKFLSTLVLAGWDRFFVLATESWIVDVAIKVIKKQYVNDPITLKRFQQEVRAAAKLQHPNIVSSFDAELDGTLNLLVMEYVDGMKMSELVKLKKLLSIRHACHFARQIAQGLQFAFEKVSAIAISSLKICWSRRTALSKSWILDWPSLQVNQPTKMKRA